MSTKGGGDLPQQQIFEIVERQAPRGLVAVAALEGAGIENAPTIAKKLRRAGLDLAPSAEKPKSSPADKPQIRATVSPSAVPPSAPAYTDEVRSEATILPPRISYWRRRVGPTPPAEFGLWDVVADLVRRYHLAKLGWAVAAFLLAWFGSLSSTNVEEPITTPINGWTAEVRIE